MITLESGVAVEVTIGTPDEGHVHVRAGEGMKNMVPYTAREFGRAVIMPNLRPPVTTTELALDYQKSILAAVPKGRNFTPLMTLYLTDNTSADEPKRAKEAGILGFKLYPAGATTNSDAGVTDLKKVYPVLEECQWEGLTLFVHGEVTHVGAEDAERVFLEEKLRTLRRDFPALKISVEHISTKEMVEWVLSENKYTFGTVTAHHLLYNRPVLFNHPEREHFLCKPELKSEVHRQALLAAVTSGTKKLAVGSDSAPHPAELKAAGGCYGCYTAHAAMEMYVEAFDSVRALDQLDGFASRNFADFHGLLYNAGTITLRRDTWDPEESYPFGEARVKPLPHQLKWKLIA